VSWPAIPALVVKHVHFVGTQLHVKLDDVQFDASTAEYLDFLIISCLHSLTSVHIVPTSILLW